MPRILVVDDEEDIRSAIVVTLKSRGFETVEADNGIDAYNLAKTQNPDVIVSDVMMYSGSGFILHELLKRDERTTAIPLILMTGHAKSAGAWGSDPAIEYLEKPFDPVILLPIIEQKIKAANRK